MRLPDKPPGARVERVHARVARGDEEVGLVDRQVAHCAAVIGPEAMFPDEGAGAP